MFVAGVDRRSGPPEWPNGLPAPEGRGEEREMAIAAMLDQDAAAWSVETLRAAWPRPALRVVPEGSDADITEISAVSAEVRIDAGDRTDELAGGRTSCGGRAQPVGAVAARTRAGSKRAVGQAVAPPGVRIGVDVGQRRARRAAVQRGRRGVVLAILTAGLVCGLSLPLSALGGSSGARYAGLDVSRAAVYVVRPGDTLWSIALRFDRGGDPRPLAEAIAKETGSAVVVPGEHIAIP